MYQGIKVACLLAVFILPAMSQTNTLILPKPTPEASPTPVPPPGDIALLDGYVHIKKRGIDTSVGEIKGSSGLVIQYDNGGLAGNVAWRMHTDLPRRNIRVLWYKEQKVNGLSLYLIRGEDKSIYATFPETCSNFYAFNVSEESLVDFLLMMMTYKHEPYKNVPMKNGRPTC